MVRKLPFALKFAVTERDLSLTVMMETKTAEMDAIANVRSKKDLHVKVVPV